MSALPPKADICSAANSSLFDHLVGAGEYCRRYCEAQRLSGFKIDHQIVLVRGLHRQIAGFLPFEDAIHVTSGEAVLVNPISSVSDQAASGREVALGVLRRQL